MDCMSKRQSRKSQPSRHLYGSSRLGIDNTTEVLSTSANLIVPDANRAHFLLKNNYEISNHLGNVLTTFSEVKIPSGAGIAVTSFAAHARTANDYYPFGAPMYGRIYPPPSGGVYRYGFNGKENDNEVKGNGNQQDYGMRIYDPRLGRFLSVDPITKKYPMLTPYQFASNRPIDGIDQDGLEHIVYNVLLSKDGKTVLKATNVSKVLRDVGSNGWGVQYKYYQNGEVIQTAFVPSDPPAFFAGTGTDAPVYIYGKKIFEQGNLEGPDGYEKAAGGVQKTGKAIKTVGVVTMVFGGAGAPIYKLGEAVETAGDLMEIHSLYSKNSTDAANLKVGNLILNKVAGKVIDKSLGDKASDLDKTLPDWLLGESTDYLLDKALDPKPDNEPIKP
jgi:RHS repeat-associated protein